MNPSGPLRRTPMPPRRTPLASRRPLIPELPAPRSLEAAGAVPVPRSPLKAARTVTAAERHAKAAVTRRSGGVCEMCRSAPAVDWSHRRAAGQGGAWRAANGLAACRRDHAACEAAPILADLGGWRLVHRDPDPATAPVYLPAWEGRPSGWWLLDDDGGMVPSPWATAPFWFPWMPRPR